MAEVIIDTVFQVLTFKARDAMRDGWAQCHDCKDEIGVGEKFIMAPRSRTARLANDTLVPVCAQCTYYRSEKEVGRLKRLLTAEENCLRRIANEANL